MSDLNLRAEIAGQSYTVDLRPLDISILLEFDGPQPNTYGVPKASAVAFEGGGFVGDTRRGGGCNFETYTLTPHCNGTHTECVGHITDERIPVAEVLRPGLVPATVISVAPIAAAATTETYDPPLVAEDWVIDAGTLHTALESTDPDFHGAIVIRTLPNSEEKLSRDYLQKPPAFFTNAAVQYLVELGLKHLLVDLPSVDRMFDEGKLSNHHYFWEVAQGSHAVDPQPALWRTITEMVFVPDFVPDGRYLLDLQIAPFLADATPSRPTLYALQSR
ncbi:MAG: cyclase family protein [Bacteroidota bacterium]